MLAVFKTMSMRRRVRLTALATQDNIRLIFNRESLGNVGDLTTRKGVRHLPSDALSLLDQIARARIKLDRLNNKELSSDFVRALIDLRHINAKVRRGAAITLGDIGDSTAIPDLIQALKRPNEGYYLPNEDEYPVDYIYIHNPVTSKPTYVVIDVRRAAAEALVKIGDAAAISALIKASEDADIEVSQLAKEALSRIASKQ